MLSAINQWAFPSNMGALDAIAKVKEIGFEGFEVCVGEGGPTPLDATEDEIAAIRRNAELNGIALHSVGCGLGWKYPLGSPDPKVREQALDINKRALRAAAWLGAEALLVVPASVAPDTPYDVAYTQALEGVRKLVPEAERLKVSIALENVWNKFLLSPLETRDFIDACESEYVGAYFDIGNIVLYGYPEQWISILGERIKAVHMKDFRASAGNFDGFVMLMEGDVNWPAVMQALRAIGYDRSLTAEYGAYAHSLVAMLKHCLTSIETIQSL
jgi:hexulose-6-phosphate isomerase